MNLQRYTRKVNQYEREVQSWQDRREIYRTINILESHNPGYYFWPSSDFQKIYALPYPEQLLPFLADETQKEKD